VEAVLVDEFQDTNIVQFDLMRLFAGQKKRITIVGDPDQSIYGFRSAEIKNLTRMRNQYPDTIVVNLGENYRSSGAILRSADQVIRQDISRPAKDLLPTHCYGSLPTLRKLPSAAAEAAWTVMEIQRAIAMTGNMLNYSDFAILLRSSSLSRNIESALGKEGVPYRMVGGHRFFDRYEIKVLLDYLRTISQPQNSDALVRIINIPARKIGDVTIKALLEEAETQKMSLWSLILDAVQGRKQPKTKLNNGHDQGLGFVINLILNARKKLGECNDAESPLELLNYVIQKISWQKHLEDKDPENHEDRWANVEELLAQAGDASVAAHSEDPGSDQLPQLENVEMQVQAGGEEALSRFLANVALSTELRQDDNEALKATVTISTVHAAKGLEWPVVFIPAAYDGSIPHSRAEDQDEERRLLYVAMTRAQSLLYVSCPRQSSQQEITLSCFLPPKVVKGRFVEKGPKFTAQIVESIAMILGRPPPSEAEIFAASLNIKHMEDNLWSANGEIDKGDEWDETRREAETHTDWPQLAKRRRIEESSTNTSIETPHEYPSFMSASRVNIMAQTTTMSQFKPSQPKTEISSGTSLVGKKQTVKNGVKVQGTLGSFFKNNQVPTADYTEREIPEIPIPLPPMKKSIPEEFSHHRLKVESITQRPPLLLNCPPSKTYHFLSSSPPALKAPKGDHEREQPPAVVEQSRGRNNMEAAPAVVRSAMTFHTTSIQQVQGMHSTTRRTLGIRRTFNGWADRMSREEKRI
jgi:DNA helicase II / ATP-dependent DNA helicase PcrA